jgi:O-antigen/teichoic acid export membrane protein
LFVGQIADSAAGIGTLFSKLARVKPFFFKNISWNEIKLAAKRYKKFPLVQSWSQLLLSLGAQLPILLLGSFYGIKVAGIFGLANGMINLPMDLIGQSVAQVYYAEISKYGKNNPQKIYALSISITKKLLWIGLIPVIILILLGPWLFSTIFGHEWHEAGLYARYLSFLILTRFISSPIANAFNVFEKQGIQLTLNIIRVILVLIIFFSCNLLNLNSITSIGIYSLGMTIYYGILIMVIFRTIKMSI